MNNKENIPTVKNTKTEILEAYEKLLEVFA